MALPLSAKWGLIANVLGEHAILIQLIFELDYIIRLRLVPIDIEIKFLFLLGLGCDLCFLLDDDISFFWLFTAETTTSEPRSQNFLAIR